MYCLRVHYLPKAETVLGASTSSQGWPENSSKQEVVSRYSKPSIYQSEVLVPAVVYRNTMDVDDKGKRVRCAYRCEGLACRVQISVAAVAFTFAEIHLD